MMGGDDPVEDRLHCRRQAALRSSGATDVDFHRKRLVRPQLGSKRGLRSAHGVPHGRGREQRGWTTWEGRIPGTGRLFYNKRLAAAPVNEIVLVMVGKSSG